MKTLTWGETPWHSLSRDELLMEVLRMAAALQSANDVMRAAEHGFEHQPYWAHGTGARARAMADQALARTEEYDGEQMYRMFFRYATDLLFTSPPGVDIGFGWAVCPVCGQMVGRSADGTSSDGRACATVLGSTCAGVMRPLEWGDLKP